MPDCRVPYESYSCQTRSNRQMVSKIGVDPTLLPLICRTGHPPVVALFATQARYKREAFRGSEFAPRILADNGLQVVMKVRGRVLRERAINHIHICSLITRF